MKTKQNMISTEPVLHGFKVVSWILYAGLYILLQQSGIHVFWISSGVKTEPSPEAEVEEELEVDELYEELPEEPVAVRRRSEGQNNSRASKAVSLMYVTVVSLFSIIFFF